MFSLLSFLRKEDDFGKKLNPELLKKVKASSIHSCILGEGVEAESSSVAQSHMAHAMARDKAGQRRVISAFSSLSSGKDMEMD